METKGTMVEHVNRKSMLIRPSGRSTDFISPSFGYGCLYNCSYCYMKRHKPEGLTVATNIGDILTAINNHAMFAVVDKPNQTHESLVTYDISCNEDFCLHAKFYDWKRIFDFFKDHPRAMGSFATKYVNKNLLEYNPEGKIRIRFSLMPQCYADYLEPNTTPILNRMEAINSFIEAGYDVHVNFSPVIYEKNWTDAYKELFIQLDHAVNPEYKDRVKAEVIFLTHNEDKHKRNLIYDLPGEHLLWRPEIQENKISEYGGENIRYKHNLKASYIDQWTELHDEIIGWNTIRYIF
jgi:spore photoproduct lyase